MIRNILVPTDFSDCAFKALLFAKEVSARTGATLHLLHVCQLLKSPLIENEEGRSDYNSELLAEANEKLQQLINKLSASPEAKAVADISSGNIETRILSAIKERHVDMVIMGTQGASGIREVIVGSITASVIEDSTVPVIAVPGDFEWVNSDKFILAIKQQEKNLGMLEPLMNLVSLFNSQLQVVAFTDEDEAEGAEFVEGAHLADSYGLMLKKKYPTINIVSKHLTGSDFQQNMQEYIDREGVDLLAMIRYPKTFLETLFRKSMTRKMAFHSKVLLMAIPAPTEE